MKYNFKRIITRLPVIAICLLCIFSACSDDVSYDIGEYKVELATVQLEDNRPFFVLDNGAKLYNGGEALSSFNTGQRVWLNYSYLTETVPGFDHVIKINGISVISLGSLLFVDQTAIDTFANDPVQFESAWIGSRYMNVKFSFQYFSQSHTVYLVTDSVRLNDPEINIEFRHSKNSDNPGYKSNAIVSYDLSRVLGEPRGEKKLRVNFNTTNYGDTIFHMIY